MSREFWIKLPFDENRMKISVQKNQLSIYDTIHKVRTL